MNSTYTEAESLYDHLEKRSTKEILEDINCEDHKVAQAVALEIPAIERLVNACYERMKDGGRLFYIGAGTSGRLALVDASECPPTFGVSAQLVNGIIAGGDRAIRQAVEGAEDNSTQGWEDLLLHAIRPIDTVIGVAASGSTPYVIGAVKKAYENGNLTGGLSCNPTSLLAKTVHHPITPLVGPEYITGSTRMKAGTAQKMILNMISTSLMIRLGHIKGNKMIDMQLSNKKLKNRAVRMLEQQLNIGTQEAQKLLEQYGSVRKVIEMY